MLASDRYKFILNYLDKNKSVTRKELADKLEVSCMTIGRYLKKLEEQGLLICTYGGAMLPNYLTEEKKYDRKKEENTEIKQLLAEKAFSLIKSNMTIILDAGTTTYELAQLISNSSLKNLYIITNDLYIALELYKKQEIHVLLLGGEISKNIGSTATIFSVQQLEQYNADIVFLGVSSISDDFDLTVPTEIKAFLKKTMLKISSKKVLLVDKTKFHKKKLYKFINIKQFNYIITDYEFSKSDIKNFDLTKKILK